MTIEKYKNPYIEIDFYIDDGFLVDAKIIYQDERFISKEINKHPTFISKHGVYITSWISPELCNREDTGFELSEEKYDIVFFLVGREREHTTLSDRLNNYKYYDQKNINRIKEALDDWSKNANEFKRFVVLCKEIK